jgi:K+-transporting ATPase ATPase C chain
MWSHLRPAIVSMAFFTLLFGIAYPLGVTGLSQAMLSRRRPAAR